MEAGKEPDGARPGGERTPAVFEESLCSGWSRDRERESGTR